MKGRARSIMYPEGKEDLPLTAEVAVPPINPTAPNEEMPPPHVIPSVCVDSY